MSLPNSKNYTIKDIYALADGQRAELIDGKFMIWFRAGIDMKMGRA